MKRIAIVGASGYAGGELARLAAAHPSLEIGTLTAARNEGRPVREVHPHLRSLGNQHFSALEVEALGDHDVVVLALPHGQSGALGEQLTERYPHLTLIDLGADRRLDSSEAWDEFYGGAHHTAWVYGMPELPLATGGQQRERLRGVSRIVAPGCNATAVTLGVAPLVSGGLIDASQLVSTLAVAPSGAGRSLRDDLLASERLSSAVAYAVGGTHRHIPEIVQNLHIAGAQGASISLTPILVPMSRGILAVTTAPTAPGVSAQSLWEGLSGVYADEPFIDLLPLGQVPATGSVLGSNTVVIGLAHDERAGQVSVVSAIDNLYKGTAGAAIQSLNIAMGWDETLGLERNGVAP